MPLFRTHRVHPTDATPLRRVDGRHYGQSSIVDETPDGSESRPYRSPFAMPRHRSSIVQSSIVIRPSFHRPIVPSSMSASSPLPMIPSPSREGTGAGFYRRRHSPAPIVNRPSSKYQQPQTNNRHFRT